MPMAHWPHIPIIAGAAIGIAGATALAFAPSGVLATARMLRRLTP